MSRARGRTSSRGPTWTGRPCSARLSTCARGALGGDGVRAGRVRGDPLRPSGQQRTRRGSAGAGRQPSDADSRSVAPIRVAGPSSRSDGRRPSTLLGVRCRHRSRMPRTGDDSVMRMQCARGRRRSGRPWSSRTLDSPLRGEPLMSMATKQSRLPELRLPEISRDSIVRGLSEMRAPGPFEDGASEHRDARHRSLEDRLPADRRRQGRHRRRRRRRDSSARAGAAGRTCSAPPSSPV